VFSPTTIPRTADELNRLFCRQDEIPIFGWMNYGNWQYRIEQVQHPIAEAFDKCSSARIPLSGSLLVKRPTKAACLVRRGLKRKWKEAANNGIIE